MRIPAVVAAATALSLGLGASLALGFTAAADPPADWGFQVDSAPLYPDGTLAFSGTKPEGSSIPDDVEVTAPGGGATSVIGNCIGLTPDDYYATEWNCSYDPEGDFTPGDGTIDFLFSDGEGGFTHNQVSFTVSAAEVPDTYLPDVTYTPGYASLTITATPTGTATSSEVWLFPWEGEGWGAGQACELDAEFTCTASGLDYGSWRIVSTQNNADGEQVSDYFEIPETPEILGVLKSDKSVDLSGSFDSYFSLSVPEQCLPESLAIEGGGWSCTTAPLAVGDYTFSTYAYDADDSATDLSGATHRAGGQSALASLDVSIEPTTPDVAYEFEPGAVIVDSTPAGAATVARTDLYNVVDGEYYYNPYDLDWADSCGGPDPEYLEGGWGWEYYTDRFDGVDSGADNYGCTFNSLDAGVWYIASQQDNGEGYPAYDLTEAVFIIPETPTLDDTVMEDDGTVTFSGYADVNTLVHVVDNEGNEVCEPTAPYYPETPGYEGPAVWSCTTEEAGAEGEVYHAYTEDTGGAWPGIPEGLSDVYVVGGKSALSRPTLPLMQYEFVPGGVIIDGTPQGDGTVIRTDLYGWAPGGGGEGEGDGFFYFDNCGGSDDEESSPFDGITPGPTHCVFTGLEPGVWNPYSQQDTGDGETQQYEWVDDYFVVPEAPLISSATVDTTGKVTLSGTTVAGNSVYVFIGNSPANGVCQSEPSDSETGVWSCTTSVLPNGGYSFRAYSEDLGAGRNDDVPGSVYMSGGLSNFSDARAATVSVVPLPNTGNTPPAGPTTPTTPTLIAPNWFFSLNGIDLNNLHPGDKFVITGSGLPPGAKIIAELHSTPTTLGTATVASDGSFSLNATVPANTEPGNHTVVVSLVGEGLEPTTKEQGVTVTAESEAAGHSAEGSGTAGEASGEGDAHGAAEGELSATAPNILTNSMNPIIDVLNDPGRIPAAFAAGLVLIIFAILPAHLLNSTIAEQYERFARRVPALRTPPKWYTSFSALLAKAPAVGGILLMAATGFLFAFADPHFGPNLHSLRLIIALSAALFVIFFIANWITATIMRRVWGVDVVVRLRPLGLILTVVGVIVSRILEFSPGFLVGVVLGLSIATSAAAQHAWKAVIIRTSVVVTFGIASWIVYSSIAPGVHHDPTFLNELILEFFVAIATEGIVLLLVELLPLHMLEGERLYKRSKLLWGAIYTVVLVVFILAVVPWAGNWRELGESFWPWFTTVAIFGAVCVAIYLYFRFIATPLHHEAHHSDGDPEVDDDERIAVGNDR